MHCVCRPTFYSSISTTYLHCHSLLQGKLKRSARVQPGWLNQGHKQGWAKMSNGRSSSGRQCARFCNRRLPGLSRGCQGRQGCTLIKDTVSREEIQYKRNIFFFKSIPQTIFFPSAPNFVTKVVISLICKDSNLRLHFPTSKAQTTEPPRTLF